MCQAGSGLGGLRTMDTAQILDVGVDKAAGKWGWAFTLKTHLQEKMVTHFPALGVRVGCAGCCSPCKSGFFPLSSSDRVLPSCLSLLLSGQEFQAFVSQSP